MSTQNISDSKKGPSSSMVWDFPLLSQGVNICAIIGSEELAFLRLCIIALHMVGLRVSQNKAKVSTSVLL